MGSKSPHPLAPDPGAGKNGRAASFTLIRGDHSRQLPLGSLLADHRSEVRLMSKSAADLLRLINGYWVSQAISVAASLRLADLLKDGPRTSEDLAQATGTYARSLYRLLRALAAARVFEEHPDRRFALAPMGEYLRSDLANSRRAWAELIGRPYVRQSWSALEDTVRTGETAFRQLYGTGIWDWRSEKPEERAIFDAAMTGLSCMAAHAVADAYDFSNSTCVVDVGGGQGALLAEILSRHAQLKGILFDLPSVVAGARPVLEEAGVADRCQALPGDMFTAVPEGGDAYLIKSVLMGEDDDNAIRFSAPVGAQCSLPRSFLSLSVCSASLIKRRKPSLAT